MTEGNDDGNYLVRVRAQVMMRDDSTGGWVPMGGGGLSNVSVRKRIIQPDTDDPKHEYLIYGKRISDQTVVLSCTIKKDFEYNVVMPTFHHWKTGDKKFGLTFQTAADARAFDKGVRMAVDDLLEGLNDFPSYRYGHNIDVGDDEVFMTLNLPVPVERDGSRSSSGSVTTCSSSRHVTPTTTPIPTPDHPPPTHHHHHHHHHHYAISPSGHHHHPGGGGPGGTSVNTTNTSPSSTTSNTATTAQHQPYTHPHANHHYLHRIAFLPRPRQPLPQNNNPPDKPQDPGDPYEHKPSGSPPDLPLDQDKIEVLGDTYSYVQFRPDQSALHEYQYPVVEGIKPGKRDSIASLKKHQQQMEMVGGTHSQPPSISGTKFRKRIERRAKKNIKARCRHCQEMFTDEVNSRGSCEYAPDCVRTAIDTLTCICCAQCMLYHCMSDAEGDFTHNPCECGGPGGAADESCGRRWVGLTLLSLLVPCLWCYLPLRACHRCAVAGGICGGRHQASATS
ncbi:unnamed protein product [Meganyctiphanes norvegica]|uniref:WH1 domain-containing protein n=1 Tax=Meganyctiphanes norvegica TaxID=48144 RepID=A0AAV2RJ86_MEGNR